MSPYLVSRTEILRPSLSIKSMLERNQYLLNIMMYNDVLSPVFDSFLEWVILDNFTVITCLPMVATENLVTLYTAVDP